jgi:hypothetical protein
MEDRDAIYRRLAKEAAKQIASWPRWMQRNLAPTKQPGEHSLEYEQGLKAGYVQGLADAAADGLDAEPSLALNPKWWKLVSDLANSADWRDRGPAPVGPPAPIPPEFGSARRAFEESIEAGLRTGQRSPRNDEPEPGFQASGRWGSSKPSEPQR